MTDAHDSVATITAVYAGVDPSQLHEALRSVQGQTLRPREVFVVADGPLTGELEAVIAEMDGKLPLTLLRLAEQSGAGPARQAALEAMSAKWVAVADADDISLPERLERQVSAARALGLDIVGSAVEEFDADNHTVLGVRRFAAGHDALREQLRTRNAFNHPSVLMNRERALEVGGYRHLPYLEDYDLCARFAAAGARMGNLDLVLVRFRGGGPSQHRRRIQGWFAAEVELQRNLHRYGLIPWWQVATNLTVRTGYRLIPRDLRYRAYARVFLAARRAVRSTDVDRVARP
jgi:glycosyltransferase involved in cell wall biosynthesis